MACPIVQLRVNNFSFRKQKASTFLGKRKAKKPCTLQNNVERRELGYEERYGSRWTICGW